MAEEVGLGALAEGAVLSAGLAERSRAATAAASGAGERVPPRPPDRHADVGRRRPRSSTRCSTSPPSS
jgi:hypothetical protein